MRGKHAKPQPERSFGATGQQLPRRGAAAQTTAMPKMTSGPARGVKTKKPKKKGKGRKVLRIIFAALLACFIGFMGFCLIGLPGIGDAENYVKSKATTVYADDGETVLGEFYLQNRRPVELTDISENVIHATVDTEDERFYSHFGVDPLGIARAIVNNIIGTSGLQGASTINQQFIRNTMLFDEMNEISIKRKVREAVLAVMLNASYSKDEILNMYLNCINYGDNCYGIEAAARHYYSKHANELTVAQAATLAGIPQSPTANCPTLYPENSQARRDAVLMRMLECGHITRAEYDEAVASDLDLKVKWEDENNGIKKYPYFTSYVRDILLRDMGTEAVYEGGMKVYTTLNIKQQKAAMKACKNQYQSIADDVEIALVAVDPDNGYITAMVGGRDFKKDQFNLATQALRQPGSSFKTFTLLSTIEAGIDPKTVINCKSRVKLKDKDDPYAEPWVVENINGHNYGNRSIASAFAVSSNTGFARLVREVGAESVVDVAHRCGIKTDLDVVDSITLGSQSVTPLEMAEAYATIANGGTHHESTPITKVIGKDDEVLYEHEIAGEQALTPEVAHAATEVMKGVFENGTASWARLSSGQVAAGKTGTSEDYRDHWLCGFTPQLCTVVWIGCRTERSVPGIDCCYVWKTFMDKALEGMPLEDFPEADDPVYDSAFKPEDDEDEDEDEDEEEEEEPELEEPEDPTIDPEPEPTPDPGPDPTPDPEPEPTPDPEPEPTPDPEPSAQSEE